MRNRHRQAMAKSASALSHQGKYEHAAVYWFMTMFSFLFHSYLQVTIVKYNKKKENGLR